MEPCGHRGRRATSWQARGHHQPPTQIGIGPDHRDGRSVPAAPTSHHRRPVTARLDIRTPIDVVFGPLDEGWDLDAVDTMTVCVHDGPRPDELLLLVGYATGPRPN